MVTTTDNQRYGILKAALVNRRYSRMAKKGLMGVQLVHKRSDQGAWGESKFSSTGSSNIAAGSKNIPGLWVGTRYKVDIWGENKSH